MLNKTSQTLNILAKVLNLLMQKVRLLQYKSPTFYGKMSDFLLNEIEGFCKDIECLNK